MNNRIFNFLKDFFNNEDIKTGYKVVNSDMYSFFQDVDAGGIEYKLNKKVFPRKNCGPLTIFDTLEDVKYHLNKLFPFPFLCPPDGFKVYKCNYKESEENMIWFEEIEKNNPWGNFWKTPLSNLLPGTKLASWVELTEEVKL